MVAHDNIDVTATCVAEVLDGRSVATAESCSAGVLAQAFAAVDGSSDWFRGGVVAYQRGVKVALLGVEPDAQLVSRPVAEQMARAASRLFDADVAVATTGAAGPDPLDGAPPGTVAIAWIVDGRVESTLLRCEGEPERVIERAAVELLEALAEALRTVAAHRALP
jgi:nicotinamide-nucleotide amidase